MADDSHAKSPEPEEPSLEPTTPRDTPTSVELGPRGEAPAPLPGPAPSLRRARSFGLASLIIVALVSAATAGAGGYFLSHRTHGSGTAASAKEMYQCPMHPTIVQDRPGNCPICGMKLVKMGAAGEASSAAEHPDSHGSSVVGLATVDIDSQRQQLIGLRTAAVTRGKVSGTWRTVGRVAVDETRVRHVNVRVPVFVERVYVNFVGKQVRQGAPLFSGFSYELLAAQEEYRIAIAGEKLRATAAGTTPGGGGLAVAARRKLELLKVPKSLIKRIEEGGKASESLTFSSPISGVVTKKDVVDGMKLEAGAMPYEIVDLSSVWVLADTYESDLGRVKLGMGAKLSLKAYPNQIFEGTVAFIDPVLDPMTRTVKVRLEFPNKGGELKPEMFGEVVLHGAERDGLKIPEDAIIDSGSKKVVFVALEAGRFTPREVALGDSDGANVEVVSGLSEGEKVVVRANFLIDSESRLRASLAALTESPPAASAAPAGSASATINPAAPSPPAAEPVRSTKATKGKAGAPGAGQATPSASVAPAPAPTYACPMHLEVTDTKASRCPKCGMFLTPGGKY